MLNTILGSTIFFIISFYFIASLMTFIVYAMDKSAAKKGHWRVKERTLHLLSFVGGWPGALIAQKILRHKSIKQPFRSFFWLTVFLNVSLLIGSFMVTDVNVLPVWISGAV
ncbi:MAG: DUF1294 domain-containing protein [Thiotrichaceae bacterium]|nr:DUF1294 domain-containing protein [Thiotrichaceae bacterium]